MIPSTKFQVSLISDGLEIKFKPFMTISRMNNVYIDKNIRRFINIFKFILCWFFPKRSKIVNVYEMSGCGQTLEILSRIGDLRKLVMNEAQIAGFVTEHYKDSLLGTNMNYFLIREGWRYFIIHVRIYSEKPHFSKYSLGDSGHWLVGNTLKIVTPQVKSPFI